MDANSNVPTFQDKLALLGSTDLRKDRDNMSCFHVTVVVIKLERLHSRVLNNLLYQLCCACIKYLNLNVESYLFGCVFFNSCTTF